MAQQLQQQLWNIANDLRGKMGADEWKRGKRKEGKYIEEYI